MFQSSLIILHSDQYWVDIDGEDEQFWEVFVIALFTENVLSFYSSTNGKPMELA
jgi:hypothetical protein